MTKRILCLVVVALLAGCASPPVTEGTGLWVSGMAGTQPVAHQSVGELQAPESSAVFTVAPVSQAQAAEMEGGSWKAGSPVSMEDLVFVTVTFHGFDGQIHTGQLVVHQELGQEVADIFQELYQAGFPLEQVEPIDRYSADDLKSMEANNTSAFCSREILGTSRVSRHSLGVAIDINPVQNPYLTGGMVLPTAGEAYLDRGDARPGMVVVDDACYQAFVSRGWIWGGHWANPDYQHFEKNIF